MKFGLKKSCKNWKEADKKDSYKENHCTIMLQREGPWHVALTNMINRTFHTWSGVNDVMTLIHAAWNTTKEQQQQDHSRGQHNTELGEKGQWHCGMINSSCDSWFDWRRCSQAETEGSTGQAWWMEYELNQRSLLSTISRWMIFPFALVVHREAWLSGLHGGYVLLNYRNGA